MLHKFFEPGVWFEPKRYGIGAGLPIAWQGWALLLSYILVMNGLALLALSGGFAAMAVAVVLMVVSTALLVAIIHRRTRGGWRWRWGDPD
jgi:hypothetical protein